MPDDSDTALLMRLFTEIGIIDQLATARAEPLLPAALTMAQFRVLNHFVRLGGQWSPARLARAFQLTRQTMTSTLARMEAAGLVRARPDPADGRGKLVALTQHGRDMFDQCNKALAPVLAETWALMPQDVVADVLPKLAHIREILDGNR